MRLRKVDLSRLLSFSSNANTAIEVSSVLLFHKTSLSLLLRISQTRLGATAVLNASLFNAIRDSQLFSADPDIGLEMENPDALANFFDLMLAVLKVVNSVVISRGNQNDQTVKLARDFLSENRFSVVGVFKRFGGVGNDGVGRIDLEELVEGFVLLISACGFLEVSQHFYSAGKGEGLKVFC